VLSHAKAELFVIYCRMSSCLLEKKVIYPDNMVDVNYHIDNDIDNVDLMKRFISDDIGMFWLLLLLGNSHY